MATISAQAADRGIMVIASSNGVDRTVNDASSSAPGSVGSAASLLVLRKALDVQAAGAAALIEALPPPQALAAEGHLGRQLNTCA